MNKFVKTAIATALLSAPMFAAAEGFSWTAAATSEYLFRGISQSDDAPAIQGSAGYGFANGLYVGAWASTVAFNDGNQPGDDATDAEYDLYFGWNGDLAENINLDVQVVRYDYIGEPMSLAYNEAIGKVTFSEQYSITLGYTNDYLNSETDSFYTGAGGTWELGEGSGYNLTLGGGYTTLNDDGVDGYFDYSIGVNKAFGPATLALTYGGTGGDAEDAFGEDSSEDKFVFTVSFGG